MLESVLVANRGEIAVRILRTLRRLGIRSIAVFSDADADARHVREADVAVRLGPAPAAQSYLDVEAVLAAARRTDAAALHPGYGFLSENPGLARACAEAGVVFVGPPPEAIEAMADKIVAKGLVAARGVPVVPGSEGRGLDDAGLLAAAREIGFPLLLKPSAGGGGKGMQVVRAEEELSSAVASARRVAASAFGDDTLLLERLVERPRHIEVQVLADAHGGVIHLGERECSLQRRHQKVIEEAPSPLLDAATRARIGAAACEVARSVGYRGAGTVEFLVPAADPGTFHFIEMNTRLQVEHPVTEQVTGLDLVELQLRIAAGEPLPLAQDDVVLRGHAIEARVYAESPARGFLPATGTVLGLVEPAGTGWRLDSGLRVGAAVTGDYDPMLAKAIATGADRAEALARLDALLAETSILGVETNVGFLRDLLAHPDVVAGDLDTGLLDRLDPPAPAEPAREDLVAAALLRHGAPGVTPWTVRDGWRPGGRAGATHHVVAGHVVAVAGPRQDALVTIDDGEPARATLDGDTLTVDGRRETVRLAADATTVWLHRAGRDLALDAPGRAEVVARRLAARVPGDGPASPEVRAAMPGTVVAVGVADGDTVAAGTVIATIEAMKMEHPLVAPVAGVVRTTLRAGDLVRLDQVVATLEAAAASDPDIHPAPESTDEET